MPYISSELVKEIRNEIKRKYPKYKFSVTRRDGSLINVAILSGPIELITHPSNTDRHENVNHYFIERNYSGDARNILLDIYNIVNRKNGVEHKDVDYGTIPKYYINIEIGKWDRPYKVVH